MTLKLIAFLTVTRQLNPWISWSVSRWLLGDPLPLCRSVFPKERLFITVRWSCTQPVMRLGWVKIWSGWKCGPSDIMDQVKYGIIENIGWLKMLARWKIWLSENVEWKIGVSEIVGRVKMWLCWLSEKFGWVKILKENPSWKKMWTEWKSGLSEKLGRAEILADPTQTCQLGLDVPNWSKP